VVLGLFSVVVVSGARAWGRPVWTRPEGWTWASIAVSALILLGTAVPLTKSLQGLRVPGEPVDVPVLQVIGTEDETWGSEMPQKYRERFPNLRRRLIEGADHGDTLTRSDEFHRAFAEMLREERGRGGRWSPRGRRTRLELWGSEPVRCLACTECSGPPGLKGCRVRIQRTGLWLVA